MNHVEAHLLQNILVLFRKPSMMRKADDFLVQPKINIGYIR